MPISETERSERIQEEEGSRAPLVDILRIRERRTGLPLRAASVMLSGIIILQIAAVIAFGSITILRYPLWSLVDEGAHFDNIVYIAQHGSLPVLGKALASEQELAIGQGVYPRHTTINPKTDGLGGLSYEAFQPPLYYLVATPIFFLSGNYHAKAIILRFFGLVLLLIAIALFARLSRHVLKQRWRLGLACGLLVFLMPGIIVRSVTISNVDLAIPMAVAAVTELWIALERRSSLRLIPAGLLVGCGVLTDLYLADLVPAFVAVALIVLSSRSTRTDMIRVAGGVALGVLVTLPWFIFNEIEYHGLTASALAKAEQIGIVNPHHVRFTIEQLPSLTTQNLFMPLMPQEWGTFLAAHGFMSYLAMLFQVMLIPTALVLAVTLWRRILTTGWWLLLLPWVCNILLCWYIDIGQQWESGAMVARYTYPTLVVLSAFIIAAVLALVRTTKPVVITVVLSTAFLVGLWIQLVPTIHSTFTA